MSRELALSPDDDQKWRAMVRIIVRGCIDELDAQGSLQACCTAAAVLWEKAKRQSTPEQAATMTDEAFLEGMMQCLVDVQAVTSRDDDEG
jgi:hypothetical protein